MRVVKVADVALAPAAMPVPDVPPVAVVVGPAEEQMSVELRFRSLRRNVRLLIIGDHKRDSYSSAFPRRKTKLAYGFITQLFKNLYYQFCHYCFLNMQAVFRLIAHD